MEQNIRVLIIDDDEKICSMFQAVLKEEGINADFALTGEEALQKIQDSTYAIIFIDVVMPVMDGMEVVQRIRERDKNIPLVLISGYSMDDIYEKINQYNICLLLRKPVRTSQIMEAIQNICVNK